MAIIHRKLTNKFTPISNNLLADKRLSWKARGLLGYMLSMKEDWQFYTAELATHSDKDGISSVRTGIQELEKVGYLKRVQPHGDHGKFDTLEWVLTDIPAFSPHTEKPHTVKPHTEKPQADNRTLTNTNKNKDLNKQKLKEKSSKAADIPYKKIIAYLNQKTNCGYRASLPANRKLIKAVWDQGYRFDDFKQVIDNKAFSWQHTKAWKYMRPATLFNLANFKKYLAENKPTKMSNNFRKIEQGTDWNQKKSDDIIISDKELDEIIKRVTG